MKLFKTVFNLHKWIGLGAAIFLVLMSATGFLLLIKKKADWIQPPTMTGAEADVSRLLPISAITSAALGAGDEAFKSLDDIERWDFRLDRRVHKLTSRHGYMEMQIDAVTGEVLSLASRGSDLLEDLHDGSWFAEWVHGWVMPLVAVSLLTLSITGVYIWAEPKIRRARRKAREAAARRAAV